MTIKDRLAIQDLVAAYGDAVVRHDGDTWCSLWTKDAVWLLGETKVEGRDAIYTLWQRAMQGYPSAAHVGFPVSISIAKQTARARWYIQEILKDTSGVTSLAFGTYDDRYRRTKVGWRFSYRRFDLLFRNPLPQDGAITLPFPADLDRPL